MSKKTKGKRAFVARPRCIYTGKDLDPSDPEMAASVEHIIPLSLGGSNQFTTSDVSRSANNLAGDKIDDAAAASFPYLMLRHRYGLQGNRKIVPSLKLRGEFIDIDAPARLEISSQGNIEFAFENEQKLSGNIVTIGSTEDRVRFLLRKRLEQAKSHKKPLITQFGQIKDEEDIEIALLLAEREDAGEFKATLGLDISAFDAARAHLMVKIALGLGNRVLGPEWAFGRGGIILRSHLFPGKKDINFGSLKGTINAELPDHIHQIFGIAEERHVMAVVPVGKTTTAIVALFGGQLGTAVVDLNYDSRPLFRKAELKGAPLEFAFSIPLTATGSRPLEKRTVQDVAAAAWFNGLLD